jgi:hypothetical protein
MITLTNHIQPSSRNRQTTIVMKFTAAVTLLSAVSTTTAFAPNHHASISKTALSASYLEQLAGPKRPHRPTSGSGISSYLDAVPIAPARVGKFPCYVGELVF